MNDFIERQAAIEVVCGACHMRPDYLKCNKHPDESTSTWCEEVTSLKALPSAQPEPLTDKEQRIFLAAMGREKKVCEEVDRNYTREPCEDSLIRVCREIERKVKGALWT